MLPDEQVTVDSEETSSEETNSDNQTQGSSTSTTENQPKLDETVDIAQTGDDDQHQDDEDTRTDDEKAADAAREELFGAPAEGENYQIEGLPEGMEIDKEALDAVAPAFRELGLSNKGASKVAQVYAEKVLPGVMERAVKDIETRVGVQRKEWEEDAKKVVAENGQSLKNKAGEVLSFDGKDLESVRSIAAKALDQLAPPEFRQWLQDTGLSVHPSMIAFAYQAGKRLAEDRDIEKGDTGNKGPKSREAKYYNR